MPYIENIIDTINTELKATSFVDVRFAGAKYYGISEQTYSEGNRYPSIQKKDGNIEAIAVDDSLPFTLYHRVDSITHGHDAGNGGYGDKDIQRLATVEAQCICVVNRIKTKLNPNQFASLLVEGLPLRFTSQQAKQLELARVIVEAVSSNLQSRPVYEAEYSNKFQLNAEVFMLAVRYRIETSYTHGCLNICACD